MQTKTCRTFADRYVDRGHFERADSVLHYALHVATQTDTPDQLGKVYRSMGYVEKERNQFAKALPYFQRAIALQRQAGNHAQVSALLVMIGHVYEQVNDQANHNAKALRL